MSWLRFLWLENPIPSKTCCSLRSSNQNLSAIALCFVRIRRWERNEILVSDPNVKKYRLCLPLNLGSSKMEFMCSVPFSSCSLYCIISAAICSKSRRSRDDGRSERASLSDLGLKNSRKQYTFRCCGLFPEKMLYLGNAWFRNFESTFSPLDTNTQKCDVEEKWKL